MKKLIILLLLSCLYAIAATAQLSATQTNQVKALIKTSVDSVRTEYKTALLLQATDSSKPATLISRIKAIEAFNKATALYPDSTIQVTGNKFGVSSLFLTAVKNSIADLQQSLTDLAGLVDTNNTEFIKLKARVDNLKLIFTIQ